MPQPCGARPLPGRSGCGWQWGGGSRCRQRSAGCSCGSGRGSARRHSRRTLFGTARRRRSLPRFAGTSQSSCGTPGDTAGPRPGCNRGHHRTLLNLQFFNFVEIAIPEHGGITSLLARTGRRTTSCTWSGMRWSWRTVSPSHTTTMHRDPSGSKLRWGVSQKGGTS